MVRTTVQRSVSTQCNQKVRPTQSLPDYVPLSTFGPMGLLSIPLQGLILIKAVKKTTKKIHCYRYDFHTLMEEKKSGGLYLKEVKPKRGSRQDNRARADGKQGVRGIKEIKQVSRVTDYNEPLRVQQYG